MALAKFPVLLESCTIKLLLLLSLLVTLTGNRKLSPAQCMVSLKGCGIYPMLSLRKAKSKKECERLVECIIRIESIPLGKVIFTPPLPSGEVGLPEPTPRISPFTTRSVLLVEQALTPVKLMVGSSMAGVIL
jgi:hypothetical protein